jgi:hypothetical protein
VYVGLWLYVTAIDPLLPVLAWHRAHSRKMQFAEFSLDVPLLWYVLKADFQQPNDISIDKAIFSGHFVGSIVLSKSRLGNCIGCFDRARGMWARMYGPSATHFTTYPLASGSMGCLYHEIGPHEIGPDFVTMTCVSEKTGSRLRFLGSKQDYLKLHDIVH